MVRKTEENNCRPEFRRKGTTGVPVWAESSFPILVFPELEQTGLVRHGFTTRLGGVSRDHLASLNLSFSRGDREENVRENFRRVAEYLQTEENRFVFTDQTHTSAIRVVTEQDAGKGLTRPRDYTDVDGLVTNVPGLVLSVFTADCVPVFLLDPRNRAIGLVHSGWRGTAGKIAGKAVERMGREYGTMPEDLICAVGPSICRDCYEISSDVAEVFQKAFPGKDEDFLIEKKNGKFQLDLWSCIRLILEEAGVPAENISITDICTCCNPDLLFSHRASHGRRGNLGAFLALR
jgi:YfiH family protein